MKSSSVQQQPIPESAHPTSSDDERELCNHMNFDDSHRVSLERVRSSYEEKRSAFEDSADVFPRNKNGTFTMEPAPAGQNQSVLQQPTDRKAVRQPEAMYPQDYSRKKCFNHVQFIDDNRNNGPGRNLRQVYTTAAQPKMMQLPSMSQPDTTFELKNPMDRFLLSRPTFDTLNGGKQRQQQQPDNAVNQQSNFGVDYSHTLPVFNGSLHSNKMHWMAIMWCHRATPRQNAKIRISKNQDTRGLMER